MTETVQEKYADKVAKLLRKAESTTPEEAELLFAKAEELMAKWALDDAMIAHAEGREEEVILEKTIKYDGIYHGARFDIGAAAARAQGCKVLISRGPKATTMHIVGFTSDVDRAVMLDSSLQIQAMSAMTRWSRDHVESWMTPMMKFKERRQFLFGFANGLEQKFAQAAARGRDELKSERVAAGESAEQFTTGMELIIRSRRDRVEDWYDERYGGTRRVSRRYSQGGPGAHHAGSFAGRNANTGSAGGLRQRGEVGGGK